MDQETALRIIYDDFDENEWGMIEESVDDGHSKHDSTNYYTIVQNKPTGDFWKIDYTSSYNHGVDEYSVSYLKVKQKEVVKVKWVRA